MLKYDYSVYVRDKDGIRRDIGDEIITWGDLKDFCAGIPSSYLEQPAQFLDTEDGRLINAKLANVYGLEERIKEEMDGDTEICLVW